MSQPSTYVTEIVLIEETKSETLKPRSSQMKKTNSSSMLLKELIGDLDSLGLEEKKTKPKEIKPK